MASSRAILFFLSSTTVLMLMITQALAITCLNDKGNYTANSTYQRNLNTLLTSLTASNNGNGYGFYKFSYGENPNRVHAIGFCRGNVAADDCRSCLNNSGVDLMAKCPNQMEAFNWLDNCTLRYSNRSIIGNMETAPSSTLYNTGDVPQSLETTFFQQLQMLRVSLKDQASKAGPLRKYAFGNTTIQPASITIYAVMDCSPDLSEKECSDCLEGSFGEFASCCYGKVGGINIRPSCFTRYETYSLNIDPASVVPLPSPPQPSPTSPP